MPDSVLRGGLGAEEMRKYPGDLNWYDWSVEHWGTKWNSSRAYVVHNKDSQTAEVYFETAWASPIPIFEAIREQYPSLNVNVSYADEDLGNNCCIWYNGEFYEPDDPVAFASDVWGVDDEMDVLY